MPYIIAIIIIALGAVGFTFFKGTTKTVEAPTPAIAEEMTPQAIPTKETIATTFKNGTYKNTVTYQTPNRTEYQLDVTLTVSNDVVTDAKVAYSQGAEKDPNAQRFEGAYKTEVIGKSLDSINLSRVGGASLTTGAFNKALTQIKTDAKS